MGNNPPRFSETQIPDNISRVSMFFCLFAPLRPRTEDNSAIFWFTNSTVISASSSNRGFSWRLMVVWRRVLIGDAYIIMTGLKIHPVQEHRRFQFPLTLVTLSVPLTVVQPSSSLLVDTLAGWRGAFFLRSGLSFLSSSFLEKVQKLYK